jgi:dTDP-4-dehydrorhamnose 3,5-epimerase
VLDLRELDISGVWLGMMPRHVDDRGWLVETFREDWFPPQLREGIRPAMSYVSLSAPGVCRGPHEHRTQTDYLVFPGPSTFRVYLWENRPGREPEDGLALELGEEKPGLLLVPPGVVHGYRNIGDRDGYVINYPNRLFKGSGRAEPVDEIRHENDPDTRFNMEV